jgi:hypothetical protein
MAGWTVPHQMGVNVQVADEPVDVSMSPLNEVVPPEGKVEGGAKTYYLISPRMNNSTIAVNRILESGGDVSRAEQTFQVGEKSYPAGTFVVRVGSVSPSFMNGLAEDLYLEIGGTNSRIPCSTRSLKMPRIALYKSWTANADEGWTRWLLEQYEFPFTNISDGEVRAGELRSRFDVLIIPSMDTASVVHGREEGTVPPRYTGGITLAGVENIGKFVREGGGTLVALRQGCLFALDTLGLPVSDALKGLRPPRRRGRMEATLASDVKFACPGSILRMEFDPDHPVAYGMPEEAPSMFYQSTAFDVVPTFEGETPRVISRYPSDNLLVSGYLKGEEHLVNKAAAVDVPMGQGRVILLGFGVKQRAQPHGTFKLLFNALYYGASR